MTSMQNPLIRLVASSVFASVAVVSLNISPLIGVELEKLVSILGHRDDAKKWFCPTTQVIGNTCLRIDPALGETLAGY